MADDGMFLNFTVGEPISTQAQKFTGGSWRHRLKAKRWAQRGGQPRDTNDANQVPLQPRRQSKEQTEDFGDLRPAKRRRENDYTPSAGQGGGNVQRSHDQRPSKGPREVISSLFSYNPKSVTATEKEENKVTEEEAAAPSNAPLVDGIDTFTSLGLSPTVAAHLLTKMNLKNPTAIQKAAISQMLKENSDAFIQSETGSGKTLAYLLPIVQRIITMADSQKGAGHTTQDPSLHRDSGLFAVILAPTRELCKQISVVLERLLGCAHYIVAGTVIGGEKKKSEKARLRKGLNILVATPGRLVDHLDNTKVLDVSAVRWLVLDEGDRLMDLGFEEDITKIVKALDEKKRKSSRQGLPDQRTTVLCSATLKMNVQKLGEISLKDAVLIKGESTDDETDREGEGTGSAFLAPAQLKQSYLVTAAKLRLVTLTALLKRTFARKGSVMKAIVFVSCADSVEFHYKVLTRASAEESSITDNHTSTTTSKPPTPPASSSSDSDADGDSGAETTPKKNKSGSSKPTAKLPAIDPSADAISPSPILSTPANPITVYKLHGSLPQATRTAIVRHFGSTTTPSLLIATDVASRGLDLPNLDLVIEYDPAFSSDDHLHRIGRTARLGRDGRAVVFLQPGKEEGYVDILRKSYKPSSDADTSRNVTHQAAEDVLKKGFSPLSGVVPTKKKTGSISTGKDGQGAATTTTTTTTTGNWEAIATTFQLDVERWVLSSQPNKDLAKRAFQSHIRAYATHIAAERKYFDIKELHLGHLAKAFGLRDPPGRVNVVGQRGGGGVPSKKRGRASDSGHGDGDAGNNNGRNKAAEVDEVGDTDDAARKMREKIRKSRALMMGKGADEFNIA
ncbi:ATP-dependent RNA helicase dbp7 [Rhinocladiella similis]